VADEPTGNLDSASTEQVFGVLRDVASQGRTVIVVTHDPGLAARADRRIQIVDGKIAKETWLSNETADADIAQERRQVVPAE
jgi:lipoprotein-releasing system ATP-binding protein